MTVRPRIDLTDASTFPTRRVEDWRWTDLARVLRTAPVPAPEFFVESGPDPFYVVPTATVFANGRWLHRSDDDPRGHAENAYASGPRNVGGNRPETPHLDAIRFLSDAGDGEGWQASVDYVVGPNDRVVIIESYEGRGRYVANVFLRFRVLAGGELTRVVILNDAPDAVTISQSSVELSEGARFAQTVLTTGAKLQRLETRVAHPGRGAEVRMDGVYVLAGDRHADLTTVVMHAGPGGATSQLTKGVVTDGSRAVFQGKIGVAKGADGADARMGHHALILSDRAEVDAKPELEIYADDVQCTHGNTVGALDESALFYMRARGMPEPQARALLTEAFLGEVLDRIEREDVREAARVWLAPRLEALS